MRTLMQLAEEQSSRLEINIRNSNARNRYFKFIIINLIALLYYSSSFAANNFANTPLYLQGKSVSTTGYSVKPNITFFIDDSGSMTTGADGMCHYRIIKCEKKPKPDDDYPYYRNCEEWDTWENPGPWSDNKVPENSIPDPPFSPDDPAEKITRIDYGKCTFTKNRIQVVQGVLKKLVDTYRNDFYFSLQPLNNYCASKDDKDWV